MTGYREYLEAGNNPADAASFALNDVEGLSFNEVEALEVSGVPENRDAWTNEDGQAYVRAVWPNAQ